LFEPVISAALEALMRSPAHLPSPDSLDAAVLLVHVIERHPVSRRRCNGKGRGTQNEEGMKTSDEKG
jgi:hypothetical protein